MLNVKLVKKRPAKVDVSAQLVSLEGLADTGHDPRQLARLGFEAKVAQTLTLPAPDGGVELLVGVGPRDELGADIIRRAGAALVRASGTNKTATVDLGPVAAPGAAQALTEGLILGSYRFGTYKGDQPVTLTAVSVVGTGDADEVRGVRRGTVIADAICFARDLVNEPGGSLTPTEFANRGAARARAAGLKARILGPKEIKAARLAGLLAVNQGSAEEPRLLELTYSPPNPVASVAFVGKGVTFDSGGLSIKPADSMMTMKNDMGGGAAAIAAACALPGLAPRVKVTAYVPMTDNMTGGAAIRPGDIYQARNGLTVEVLNTDAEGRLVLSDVLVMASEAKPDAIIDLATLTGACMVALGDRYAGVLGNDQPLIDQVRAAAVMAGERVWPLPLAKEYLPLLESNVADVKNIASSRWGGTITAALFLEKFVGNGIPWVHIDLAGPAFNEGGEWDVTPKGGTGFGVATLLAFVESVADRKK